MTLTGKGFFIWKIKDCQAGDASAIAEEAYKAGFSHVLIKIANGAYAYNWDTVNNVDRIPPVVDALRRYGIQVWGWHYVYGYNPVGEARKAIAQVKKYNLDGYVIDAEGEFKQAGMDVAARNFMSELRAGLPNTIVALCSYRWPSYHPQFPWKIFLDRCDLNMPMVYWLKAHNPAAQLSRCVQEFQAMSPIRQIIPVGPAYMEAGWAPTAADINEFFSAVKSLKLSAANFFSWDECRRDLPVIWDAVSQFQWNPAAAGTLTTAAQAASAYINALNTPNTLINLQKLYAENAILVTAQSTIKGWSAISGHFSTLLDRVKSAIFTLTGSQNHQNSCSFSWKASSSTAAINNGSDTIGIRDGKIVYHYSSFTVN